MLAIIVVSDGLSIGIYDANLRDNGPMKYPDFALRFAALIKEKRGDISQSEVGKWLGVSQPTVNSWLNGDAMPGMPKAIEICKKLDCCVEYLLTGNGPKRFAVDLNDEKHLRILMALKSAKVAIDRDGSQFARDNERALYQFALDRAMTGEVTDSQLSAFLQALVSH